MRLTIFNNYREASGYLAETGKPSALLIDRHTFDAAEGTDAEGNNKTRPTVVTGPMDTTSLLRKGAILSRSIVFLPHVNQRDAANALHAIGILNASWTSPELSIPQDSHSVSRQIPLKVLVVEDNIVNQKVTSQILRRAGHTPFVVQGADEALDLLEKEEFDVVLMDINMPGTSGLDAVKLYRFAHLGDSFRLPFIALTADATPEARLHSEEAGMDGYLTKPVEAEKLIAAIESVVAGNVRANDASDRRADISHIAEHPLYRGDNDPSIDFHTVEELLKLGNGEEFFRDLIEDFIRDSESTINEISQHLNRGDRNGVREAVHALRSSAAYVGAARLHRVAHPLMAFGPEASRKSGAVHLQRIRDEFDAFRRDVKGYLEHFDRSQSPLE